MTLELIRPLKKLRISDNIENRRTHILLRELGVSEDILSLSIPLMRKTKEDIQFILNEVNRLYRVKSQYIHPRLHTDSQEGAVQLNSLVRLIRKRLNRLLSGEYIIRLQTPLKPIVEKSCKCGCGAIIYTARYRKFATSDCRKKFHNKKKQNIVRQPLVKTCACGCGISFNISNIGAGRERLFATRQCRIKFSYKSSKQKQNKTCACGCGATFETTNKQKIFATIRCKKLAGNKNWKKRQKSAVQRIRELELLTQNLLLVLFNYTKKV